VLVKLNSERFRKSLRSTSVGLKWGTIRVLDQISRHAATAAQHTSKFTTRTQGPRGLRGSIKVTGEGGLFRRFVRAGAKHAGFVENGTKPHLITADFGIKGAHKFLRFEVNGKVLYRRGVQHKGTKATHFMRDTAIGMRPLFERAMRAMVENTISANR
jgi:hypothetical protein